MACIAVKPVEGKALHTQPSAAAAMLSGNPPVPACRVIQAGKPCVCVCVPTAAVTQLDAVRERAVCELLCLLPCRLLEEEGDWMR